MAAGERDHGATDQGQDPIIDGRSRDAVEATRGAETSARLCGAKGGAEPDRLLCSVTQVMFRDPVFVPESGNTYERDAILQYWASQARPRDPLTNTLLQTTALYTNWGVRREVQRFLEASPDYTPQGWTGCRVVPAPALDAAGVSRLPHIGGWRPARASIMLGIASLFVLWLAVLWTRSTPSSGARLDALHHGPTTENQLLEERLGLQFPRPPRGSKLHVQHDGQQLNIRIPAAGFSSETIGQVLFAVVWLSVTYVWTAGMWQGNAPFIIIAFSLVFWSSGAQMVVKVGRMLLVSEVLAADGQSYLLSSEIFGRPFEETYGFLSDLAMRPDVECFEGSSCAIFLDDLQLDAPLYIPMDSHLRRADATYLQSVLLEHLLKVGSLTLPEGVPEATAQPAQQQDDKRSGRHRRSPSIPTPLNTLGPATPFGTVGGFGGGFAFGPGFAFVLR
eukprot:TRINITY_DN16112_c0_g3_i1.p1 TRINITY_DN16112_c0_g3~~TRINITY_DN16112_c0_g3_i1.p1  ORF type:complete len:469 (-),score=45.48 TRINITY_DN16112_c0_g3_i1:179-1522(-)